MLDIFTVTVKREWALSKLVASGKCGADPQIVIVLLLVSDLQLDRSLRSLSRSRAREELGRYPEELQRSRGLGMRSTGGSSSRLEFLPSHATGDRALQAR